MATKHEKRAQRREEREEHVKAQRDRYARRQRNRRIINYSIGAIVILLLAFGAYRLFRTDAPGQYDDLAQCIASTGTIMYGTDWCPHCQAQKQLFGRSFRYVTYVNCDVNPTACELAGVEGYPTWVFPQGPPLSGEQTLETLAARSGCTL